MARGSGVVLIWLGLVVSLAEKTCNHSDPMALLQRRMRPSRQAEGFLEHQTSEERNVHECLEEE